MGNPIYSDPSIFYKNQAQNDGTFNAIASLCQEEGIDNLAPAPENNELLGMERILQYWMNLDQQEPRLKILCPERNLGSRLWTADVYPVLPAQCHGTH
jgi:hypothetical protein